ncbi:MAG TPA: hypothetical protein VGR08_00880 [Thermomicrobiales bacterium]|nr:hypothetical protein [Thermomicrobiales bacterium]
MSVPLQTPTPADRVLIRLEQERRNSAEGSAAAWGFLWVLFGFKIATVGVIWWAAAGSGEDLSVIMATTWYWMVIPIGALAGPLLIRWRMVKLRRRREALRRSEWMMDAAPDTGAPAPPATPAPSVPWDRSRPNR